ncbi:T9SS type A sorting domain-containing protein [Tenacibaculum amylolyticum]|uniref:T9SS type A sorting domain-containing protein n=1 Tax=Tenacibaculum amylolyticum TaxID=104269 RepID=UPI00389594B1
MKRKVLLLFLGLSMLIVKSQTTLETPPDWGAISLFGGTQAERVIEMEKKGEFIYILGSFYGKTTLENQVIESEGINSNFFLAKFNDSGELLWVTQSDSKLNGSVSAYQLKVYNDKIYVLGEFKDGDKLANTELFTTGEEYNYFLTEYDLSGNLVHHVTMGTNEKFRRIAYSDRYISPRFTINTTTNELYVIIFNKLYTISQDFSNVSYTRDLDRNIVVTDIIFFKGNINIVGYIRETAYLDAYVLNSTSFLYNLFYASLDTNFVTRWAYAIAHRNNNSGVSNGGKFIIKNGELFLFGMLYYKGGTLANLSLPDPANDTYSFIVSVNDDTGNLNSLNVFDEYNGETLTNFLDARPLYDERNSLSIIVYGLENATSIRRLVFNPDNTVTLSTTKASNYIFPAYPSDNEELNSVIDEDSLQLSFRKVVDGEEQWRKEFVSENSLNSNVIDVVSDKENHYYALLNDGSGTNNVFGSNNYTIAKFDLDNNVIWSHTIKGEFKPAIQIGEHIQYNNKAVYLAGVITSEIEINGEAIRPNIDGERSLFIVKFSEEGIIENNITHAIDIDSSFYSYEDIAILNNGDILVSVVSFSKVVVALFDESLNYKKSLRIDTEGNSPNILDINLVKGINNTFYLAGTFTGDRITYNGVTFDKTGNDSTINGKKVVFEINDELEVLNVFNYGHTTDAYNLDYRRVKITGDNLGNKFVTGFLDTSQQTTYSFNNLAVNLSTRYEQVLYLGKINNDNDFSWVKMFSASAQIRSYDTTADFEGNLYVSGTFWGNLYINDTIELNGSYEDGSNSFVMKLDNNGNVLWVKTIASTNFSIITSTATTNNENELIVGGRFNRYSIFDNDNVFRAEGINKGFLGVLGKAVLDVDDYTVNNGTGVSVFPNPSNGVFNVNLPEKLLKSKFYAQVFDLNGRVVYSKTVTEHIDSLQLNFKSIGRGMYILRLTDGVNKYANKIILK